MIILCILNTKIYRVVVRLKRSMSKHQNEDAKGTYNGQYNALHDDLDFYLIINDLQIELISKLFILHYVETVKSQRRKNQHRNNFNLTVILFVTVLMFFFFTIPRVLMSIYEAATIQNMLRCSKKRKGYYQIWYLYVQATLQLLQVCPPYHYIFPPLPYTRC